MTRFVVAAQFRWDEYPGLRPGRIASGKGDVERSPLGEAHYVADPDAAQTLCGLQRAAFAYEFPHRQSFTAPAEPCQKCQAST